MEKRKEVSAAKPTVRIAKYNEPPDNKDEHERK